MKIDENQDLDYDVVRITNIGFVDPYGNEGLVVLKADDNKEFHMRAFSGEVYAILQDLWMVTMILFQQLTKC